MTCIVNVVIVHSHKQDVHIYKRTHIIPSHPPALQGKMLKWGNHYYSKHWVIHLSTPTNSTVQCTLRRLIVVCCYCTGALSQHLSCTQIPHQSILSVQHDVVIYQTKVSYKLMSQKNKWDLPQWHDITSETVRKWHPIFHMIEPTKPDRTRKSRTRTRTKTKTKTEVEIKIKIRIRITNEEVVPSHMPPPLGRLMHTPPPSLGRTERGLDGVQVPVQTSNSFSSVARRSKWSNLDLSPRGSSRTLSSRGRGPTVRASGPACLRELFIRGGETTVWKRTRITMERFEPFSWQFRGHFHYSASS